MEQINIHQAKTHLSHLLLRVAEGEEIIIAKAGKPVARLMPIQPIAEKRPVGIQCFDNFNDPLPPAVVNSFLGV
jgi:prevent-host-death family protein